MDRSAALERRGEAGMAAGAAAAALLPSRAAALSALASALQSQSGPVLLTGEPGVGKSWLHSKLIDRLGPAWRPLVVDLSPALDAASLYRLILRGLAVAQIPPDAASARLALDDRLLEAADEEELWLLIAEECHAASDELLEELRILGNRLGRRAGLGGMLLVGQMSVARRLSLRPLNALGQRLAARVHLRPLGVEELAVWLADLGASRPDDPTFVERLHLETRGNPRQCGRRLDALERTRRPFPSILDETERTAPNPATVLPLAEPARPPLDLTAAVPARPPLEVADDMIEVGWDARIEEPSDPVRASSDPVLGATSNDNPPEIGEACSVATSCHVEDLPSVEVVEDRYAALQAWDEWMRNQGRAAAAPSDGLEDEAVEIYDDAPAETSPQAVAGPILPPEVRAEGQHGFAPYSQLFSRLREMTDPNT